MKTNFYIYDGYNADNVEVGKWPRKILVSVH
jgi:hypothetical protein